MKVCCEVGEAVLWFHRPHFVLYPGPSTNYEITIITAFIMSGTHQPI